MKVSTICIFALLGLPIAAQSAAQPRQYKAGQRVEYHLEGKWLKAIITEIRNSDDLAAKPRPYHIHPLGYNTTMDTWVPQDPTYIRPAGSGPTETVPGGEANDEVLKAMGGSTSATPAQPPAKSYHCVYFVGGNLVDAAPFTLTANSAYTDSDGKRGTYNFVLASATLTFHGGNYDGQRAEFDTKGGLPQLHILGPSGRQVIDCD